MEFKHISLIRVKRSNFPQTFSNGTIIDGLHIRVDRVDSGGKQVGN